MSRLEERLAEAMHAGADQVEPSPDLFARIELSLEDARGRRRWRARVAGWIGAATAAVAALLAAVTNYREGELIMDWWVLELLTTALLVGLAFTLGPFIKRFGKSYAADVFRANPRTGKSFIVLTDFAYYLIFLAYILFTISFEAGGDWEQTVNANQLKDEVARVGGIVLIIGILHGLNLVALPVMGRLLSLNRTLDDAVANGSGPAPAGGGRRHRGRGVDLPPGGQWVLRIEPVTEASEVEERGP
jgi:MFS family permease